MPMRYRVAEQLMLFDYLWSIQDWLGPQFTLKDLQKLQAVVSLGGVYEGVLSVVVDSQIAQRTNSDPWLDSIIKDMRRGEWRFYDLIKLVQRLDLSDVSQIAEFDKMRQVRNWVHISKEQEDELIKWFNSMTYEQFAKSVEEFRKKSLSILTT